MPRKHRDSSNRINLERNLGESGSKPMTDEERQGGGRPGRPFVDVELQDEADRAAMVYLRNYSGKGPRNYNRSDERIREDVCQALYVNYAVDASKIDVDVKDHCVYLRGQVEDRATKKMAEDVVEFVPGVTDVQNKLTFIKEEPPMRRKLSESERDFVDTFKK